jgi:hypothetical protein
VINGRLNTILIALPRVRGALHYWEGRIISTISGQVDLRSFTNAHGTVSMSEWTPLPEKAKAAFVIHVC